MIWTLRRHVAASSTETGRNTERVSRSVDRWVPWHARAVPGVQCTRPHFVIQPACPSHRGYAGVGMTRQCGNDREAARSGFSQPLWADLPMACETTMLMARTSQLCSRLLPDDSIHIEDVFGE